MYSKLNFLLIACMTLLGLSCDPCQNTTCQNDGTCIDGDCECLPGFEGSQCEIWTSSKISGNLVITSDCNGGTAESNEWSIGNSATAPNEVLINSFHYLAKSVIATITDPNTIEIESQTIDSPTGDLVTVQGSGIIISDGQLMVDYMLWGVDNPDTIRCTVNAVRQ